MTVDLAAAADFLASSARVLDRRRFDLLFGDGDAGAVLAAVDGYRNPDGGYGWGLEPDLRSRTSQPGGALHAFEAFADAAPVVTERARELCDWLDAVSLPDGGLPFALPVPIRPPAHPSGPPPTRGPRRCRSPRSWRCGRTGSPRRTPLLPPIPGSPAPPSTACRRFGVSSRSRTRWCWRSLPSSSTPLPRRSLRPPTSSTRCARTCPPTGCCTWA